MSNTTPDDAQSLCDQINHIVATDQAQANAEGERFNIFSILRMQRDETRTHSRFIYELISPGGRHGEGTTFLALFIQHVLDGGANADDMRIRREDPTEDGRRIDLTLSSPDTLIGIELKIDAEDQTGQLHDYYRELERRAAPDKRFRLYYLTLDGKPASTASLRSLKETDYQCRSFREDIHRWLQACIQHCDSKPVLREAIGQYLRLIESLTGRNHNMSRTIATTLLSSPNNFNAALEIENALQQAKIQLLQRFWTQLHTAITDRLKVTPVLRGDRTLEALSTRYYQDRKNNRHLGFSFPVPGAPSTPGLHIDINLYHAIHYGVRLQSDQGLFIPVDAQLRKKLRNRLGEGNAIADKHQDWVNCFYHPPRGSHPHALNFKSFQGQVRQLPNDATLQAIITEMVDHIEELIQTLTDPAAAMESDSSQAYQGCSSVE